MDLTSNVSCKLLDVLTVTNETDNSTYYYYLASIKNKGKKPFNTQELYYTVTDNNEKILVSLININRHQHMRSAKDKVHIFMDILVFQIMIRKTWVYLSIRKSNSCLLKHLTFVRRVIKM